MMRVLIVGAGLGGQLLNALLRRRGIETTLVERVVGSDGGVVGRCVGEASRPRSSSGSPGRAGAATSWRSGALGAAPLSTSVSALRSREPDVSSRRDETYQERVLDRFHGSSP
jgi:hypothetical protein